MPREYFASTYADGRAPRPYIQTQEPRPMRPAPQTRQTDATRPPHAPKPAPVRPHEIIVSATVQHSAGPHPAVLLAHDAGTIYIDTRRQYLELPASAGTPARTAALAPGRITIARRDAFNLAAWRRTLAGEL